MAYKIGIAGVPNSGKSYSRRTIPDGENVIILAPSLKATHLKDSKKVPLKPFDVKTTKFKNMGEYMEALKVTSSTTVIDYMNKHLAPGTLKPENITGNIQVLNQLDSLPIWLRFVSEHLPWVHTVIMPDFTHFISKVISTDAFINRKAGGEAYQRFWELAAEALKNFIISIDNYRDDLLVVTEYHAEYDEYLPGYDIFTPAGKMLKEKFLVPSYYDVLLFTDVEMPEDENKEANYRFVTRPTKRYPFARSMNLFKSTYISNDLHVVLDTVREYLGIPWKKEQAA